MSILRVFSLISILGMVVGQQGHYCDEWNRCASGYYCFNRKCQVLKCADEAACGSGFVCEGGYCNPTQHA